MPTRTAFIGLLAGASLLILSACKEAPSKPAESPAPIVQEGRLRYTPDHPQLALLTTVKAEPAGVAVLELPAKVVWNEERTQRVIPSFAGKVSAIHVDVGQTVQAGMALAEISSADFGSAQADVAKAMADAELSRKALARQTELFEAGIVARKDLEQAQADQQRAQAELARAKARTAAYGAAGFDINQRLAMRSTLPGVVVERNLNPGQDLRPDPYGPGVPPLFVISDPSVLWVQIDVRESDLYAINKGSVFVLEVASLPGQVFEGRVTAMADTLDPATRTIKVRGVVNNPKRVLKAEMLGTARFEASQGDGVVVPASAVALAGTQHAVYVKTGAGVFERREVGVSRQDTRQVVIHKGLAAGEEVVSDNLLLLARTFRLAQSETQAASSESKDKSPAGEAPVRKTP